MKERRVDGRNDLRLYNSILYKHFGDEFLRHEIEFYREKYTESQKKEAMAFILSKFEDACVDGEFEGATDSMVAFIEEKLEEFDNVNKNAFKE